MKLNLFTCFGLKTFTVSHNLRDLVTLRGMDSKGGDVTEKTNIKPKHHYQHLGDVRFTKLLMLVCF